MQKSKLIRLLRTLTVEEMRELGYFIDSPYFNTSQQVKKLFKYLRRSHPVYESVRIQKEKAFEKLFPEIPDFDDARMRQVMFKLTRLVEDFLVAEEIRKEKAHRQKHLIKALGKRNLYKDFTREINGRLKELEAQPHKDMEDFQEVLFLNHELFFHPETPKFKTDIQSIEEVMNALDTFFVMGKLQYGCEMTGRENILSLDYEIWLLNEVKNSKLIPGNMVFTIFSKISTLLKSPSNFILFEETKLLWVQNISKFNTPQKQIVLQHLTNYAVGHINKGESSFLRSQFDLFKIAISNDLYLENNRLTDSRFVNIAAAGSALKEFDWTKNFIDKYDIFLEKSVLESAKNLALAYWNFNKGLYEEVLSNLNNIEFLPSYGFRVKSLRMRAFFEISNEKDNYIEALFSDMNSFEQYIRRNSRINAKTKLSYLNLIQLTRKIVRLRNGNTSSKSALKRELDQLSPIALRSWIKEKLEE